MSNLVDFSLDRFLGHFRIRMMLEDLLSDLQTDS